MDFQTLGILGWINEPDVQYLRDLITLLKTFSNVDKTRIRISPVLNGAALACVIFLEIASHHPL